MAVEKSREQIVFRIRQRQAFLDSLQPDDPIFKNVFGDTSSEALTPKRINAVKEIAAVEGLYDEAFSRQVRAIIIENGLHPKTKIIDNKLFMEILTESSRLRELMHQNVDSKANPRTLLTSTGVKRRSGSSGKR